MKRQTLPGFSAESSFDTTDGKYYENQSSFLYVDVRVIPQAISCTQCRRICRTYPDLCDWCRSTCV
jgi:hypothetical protein